MEGTLKPDKALQRLAIFREKKDSVGKAKEVSERQVLLQSTMREEEDDQIIARPKKELENHRILLLDCNVEYKKGEGQTYFEAMKEGDFTKDGEMQVQVHQGQGAVAAMHLHPPGVTIVGPFVNFNQGSKTYLWILTARMILVLMQRRHVRVTFCEGSLCMNR